MRPADDYRNGDCGSGGSGGGSGDSGGEESSSWGVCEGGAVLRALSALNALRKSRQSYDVVLVAEGAELPAHRALLAAHAPALLPALSDKDHYRLDGVQASAVREVLEYMYTGRARARSGAGARALYVAAWRLRAEGLRAALAARLLRHLAPADCLELRALPDLPADHLRALDHYIADNFDAICDSGALASLPLVRLDVLPGEGALAAGDSPLALAHAALDWLRDQLQTNTIRELTARLHLVYACEGLLRDCGARAAARGEAAELQEYRREAAARDKRAAAASRDAAPPAKLADGHDLGARDARPDFAVLAARCTNVNGPSPCTRALLSLGGAVVCVRAGVRAAGARGGAALPAGPERAALPAGRCALGGAVLGARLLVCGGYDRARVLRAAAAYCARDNQWRALPDMRSARARFPAARLDGKLYVIGGSDGHNELDTVDVYSEEDGVGRWSGRARLPHAVSHAAAAAVEAGAGAGAGEADEAEDEVEDEEEAREVAAGGALYVIGGWAGGRPLRAVLRYSAARDAWAPAAALGTARSQCGACVWAGWTWAVGGCDAWHCVAGTERRRAGGRWRAGPALPTARRSVGAAAWRGLLVSAGGSDGACSLRRVDYLQAAAGPWRPAPALRRPRAGLGLADLDHVLYAVGGFDGKEFLSCVECLYSLDGEWTTLVCPPALAAPPHKEASDAPVETEAEAEKAAVEAPVKSPEEVPVKSPVELSVNISVEAPVKTTVEPLLDAPVKSPVEAAAEAVAEAAADAATPV